MIVWAQKCNRPRCIPSSRPRGVKAEGLRYEGALARALAPAVRGQWWQYRADGPMRYCQTDLLLGAVIVECKLSWVPEGQRSLDELYLPVVSRALDRPARGFVACRYLRRGMSGVEVVEDFETALAAIAYGKSVVLHWLPGTPVWKLAA